MSLNPKWVPMRWPCGPIEAARIAKSPHPDSGIAQPADPWANPAALQLLKGTPINCLVVDWAAGTTDDQAQQRALAPLIAAGRELGLSFVGKLRSGEGLAANVAAAATAGLEAVMLDAPARPNGSATGSASATHSLALPVILGFPRDTIDWARTTQIFSTTANVWPGVVLPTMTGDTGIGGPTGDPWVDSNGWFVLLARRMAPHRSLWLEIDLPPSSAPLTAQSYCRAIADSRAYGAHWVLALDDATRAGILRAHPQALATWQSIAQTLAFFGDHPEWPAFEPMGVLAVVSDFSGKNLFLSGEALNLLSRRHVQFEILNRRQAFAAPVTGLKAILWADDDQPGSVQLNHLLAFIQAGGLLIAPAYWGPAAIEPRQESWLPGYSIYNLGKGRIAVASGGFSDPYQLARDTHLLVGRQNDLARLFNPGTTGCFTGIGPGRRKQIVHVVNYAERASRFLAVWVNGNPHQASLWSPASQVPRPLDHHPESSGTSFELPEFSVNCVLEIERIA